MDSTPEREQPKPERVIALGEDFYLFDPEYTNQPISPMEVKVYESSILLNIQDALRIPLNIGTHSGRTSKGYCITPFDPETDHRINSEDLELDSRQLKMGRLKIELGKTINFSKDPVNLDTQAYDTALNELGFNEEDEAGYKFSEEMLDLLNRLRVLVSFPKGLYVARPWKTSLSLGNIDFHFFYPADAEPLPIKSYYFLLYEGFPLLLPSDPEKLSQIRARFALVEEQPQEEV